MTSTELNLGIHANNRPSSRVLKPPGGGHSNIFADDEVRAPPPRPKSHQQNSSNLNFVMNTTDPNLIVEKARGHIEKLQVTETKPQPQAPQKSESVVVKPEKLPSPSQPLPPSQSSQPKEEKPSQQPKEEKPTTTPSPIISPTIIKNQSNGSVNNHNNNNIIPRESPKDDNNTGRGRIPPGGFSSGFW